MTNCSDVARREADALLAGALTYLRDRRTAIMSLVKVFDGDLSGVETELARSSDLLRDDGSGGGAWLQAWLPELRPQVEALAREWSEQSAKLVLHEARAVAASACLVFTHSLLDEVALRCCRAIVMLDRQAAMSWFGGRKVSLAEVASMEQSDMLGPILLTFVDELQQKSMPFKIDRIMQVCGAVSLTNRPRGYAYRRELIVLADDARHGVVHRLALWESDPRLPAEMLLTAEHLILRVAERYGLTIAPSGAVGGDGPVRGSLSDPAEGRT